MFGIIETGEDENENKGGASCDIELPTIEQVLKLWNNHFEVLLKFSKNHKKELLEQFESDTLKYIKDIPTPQK